MFTQSIRALSRSWVRTSLSVVGVAIGIAGVVMLIGAGAGAELALRKALEPMGKNLLLVAAAQVESSALRGSVRTWDTLTLEDCRAIRELPDVVEAVPVVGGQMLSSYRGRNVSTRVTGTTPEFETVRSFPLIAGRFIDDDDLKLRSRVAVVGQLVVDELFRGEIPLDETLFVRGVPFRIIGVTARKGVSADGANEDELVILPLTTIMGRLMDADSLGLIFVQAASEESLPAAQSDITKLLRQRHAAAQRAPMLAGSAQDDFVVTDQAAMVRAQREARRPLSRLVSYAAVLALGLGGFGLLAVSLLSVRERFAEIGLRLAIGGLPRDILLQFFTEAVLISLLGGVAGLALGTVGIEIGTRLTRWPMALSWEAAAFPLALSVAIGIVFGAYPAFRAAQLNPILALRSK